MSDRKDGEHLYRIQFFNQGEVFELYSREISQGGLFGFIEVGELSFGERSQVVVDPSEERLKTEFKGVRRIYVPMHAVIRIDEVDREGVSRISEPVGKDGNVRPFPGPIYTPQDSGNKS